MNWKGWLAIVTVLLVGFLVVSFTSRQRWVKRDVERQLQIAQLQAEADRWSAVATEESRRKDAAMASAAVHAAARAQSDAELRAMRKKWKNRPVVKTAPELVAQLAQADAYIAKLESDLSRADLTIISLNDALIASDAEAMALRSQVDANEKAWLIERDRTESWQQQTKRGRVKTAFLTIGAAAGGGLAGYGIGVTTQ